MDCKFAENKQKTGEDDLWEWATAEEREGQRPLPCETSGEAGETEEPAKDTEKEYPAYSRLLGGQQLAQPPDKEPSIESFWVLLTQHLES